MGTVANGSDEFEGAAGSRFWPSNMLSSIRSRSLSTFKALNPIQPTLTLKAGAYPRAAVRRCVLPPGCVKLPSLFATISNMSVRCVMRVRAWDACGGLYTVLLFNRFGALEKGLVRCTVLCGESC